MDRQGTGTQTGIFLSPYIERIGSRDIDRNIPVPRHWTNRKQGHRQEYSFPQTLDRKGGGTQTGIFLLQTLDRQEARTQTGIFLSPETKHIGSRAQTGIFLVSNIGQTGSRDTERNICVP